MTSKKCITYKCSSPLKNPFNESNVSVTIKKTRKENLQSKTILTYTCWLFVVILQIHKFSIGCPHTLL